jgi:hypothetical protein
MKALLLATAAALTLTVTPVMAEPYAEKVSKIYGSSCEITAFQTPKMFCSNTVKIAVFSNRTIAYYFILDDGGLISVNLNAPVLENGMPGFQIYELSVKGIQYPVKGKCFLDPVEMNFTCRFETLDRNPALDIHVTKFYDSELLCEGLKPCSAFLVTP